MTIEIHRPELQALIQERLAQGVFQSVEDVLWQALQSTPPAAATAVPTSDDLISAMQASLYKDICLEPGRSPMPVRDVTF